MEIDQETPSSLIEFLNDSFNYQVCSLFMKYPGVF